MPRAKPQVVKLSDLAPGEGGDFFAQLAERVRQQTQFGKPFYNCRFRDARRTVSVAIWHGTALFDVCANEWQVGQNYKLRATFDEHEKYGPVLNIEQIRPVSDDDAADGFDLFDLVERSRFDPDALHAELLALVTEEIADEPLRALVLSLLEAHAAPLRLLPATPKHYHPFAGGWLEHTLSVARSCASLVDKYRALYADLHPPLNKDLVIAGAVLHEIGRVAELQPPLGVEQTVAGRLHGHLTLGRDLVREAARGIENLDPELLLLLEHVILTHLTLPEWGSPRLPAIPECLILHHADDLDAKMEMYARCLTRDQSPGPFTDRDPVLGKPLFKGRRV